MSKTSNNSNAPSVASQSRDRQAEPQRLRSVSRVSQHTRQPQRHHCSQSHVAAYDSRSRSASGSQRDHGRKASKYGNRSSYEADVLTNKTTFSTDNEDTFLGGSGQNRGQPQHKFLIKHDYDGSDADTLFDNSSQVSKDVEVPKTKEEPQQDQDQKKEKKFREQKMQQQQQKGQIEDAGDIAMAGEPSQEIDITNPNKINRDYSNQNDTANPNRATTGHFSQQGSNKKQSDLDALPDENSSPYE